MAFALAHTLHPNRTRRSLGVLAAVGALLVPMFSGCALPSTAATANPSVCFASDVQAGLAGFQARFASYLKTLQCDRIVMPGDLTNDGFASQYSIFNGWYGAVKGKILPARGNHDARSPLANYLAYWGSRVTTAGQPWYAVNLGAWHIVSLDVTGASVPTAELTWLKQNLDANRGKPTLAFWHVPRYSSGFYGDNGLPEPIWTILAAHGADIVVNGHVHVAQRFAITRGIREWIDSSAGFGLHNGTRTSSVRRAWVVPGPQFGVLRLVLKPASYDWSFRNLSGALLDTGSAAVT